MKKLIISLGAIAVLIGLTASCSGPVTVWKGTLQRNDTIFIVTQPGFVYRVSVIPELPKVKEDPNYEPQIFSGPIKILNTKLLKTAGISYDFYPCMDTMHIIRIMRPDGEEKKACWEMNGDFYFDCDGVEGNVPCNQDQTVDCNDYLPDEP